MQITLTVFGNVIAIFLPFVALCLNCCIPLQMSQAGLITWACRGLVSVCLQGFLVRPLCLLGRANCDPR